MSGSETAEDLGTRLSSLGLTLLGTSPPDPPHTPPGTQTIALIGPAGGAGWWDIVTGSAEWLDGEPDPVDRWSRRVLDGVARELGAIALFPFEGPPWFPFQRWALASGRCWESPIRFLVHADAGLWVSFRGALALPFRLHLAPAPSPCKTCAEQPCRTACPAHALTGAGYDLPACHGYLDSPAGVECLSQGCRVRAACPVSVGHARLPLQSAYHMSRFHP